jgi:hypothetical protein
MLDTALSVRDLRRKWKPHKDRLKSHPTAIRFHRACSWLEKAQQLNAAVDADLVLVNQWIALNALYGRWDANACEPLSDRESLRQFLDRVLQLDKPNNLGQLLVSHKPLVLSILEDEYLASFFWKAPSPDSKRQARNHKHKALSLYVEKNWTLLLDRLLERIYLLRCQLIHGAATCGGKLNRTALRRATTALRQLLPALLLVIVDHGADEDWGLLCYPPLDGKASLNGKSFQPGKPR